MKGVTHAVVFERPTNVSQPEAQLMQTQLQNANFEQNVLPTSGRSFKLEDLSKILVESSIKEKLNILYNKYFYGFEKEGKSAYFQEKAVTGFYLPFRYPFREDLLDSTLMQALNVPLGSADALKPKDLEGEARAEQDKENRFKKQFEQMTLKEQRKVERDKKQQKRVEADLEPERILREEMDKARRLVTGT